LKIYINGQEWQPAGDISQVVANYQPEVCWQDQVLVWMDRVESILKKLLPPSGAMLAAAPVGGELVTKLWPLVGKLQQFGLAVGIAMSLWGLCRFIMGDPSGKKLIGDAIIGFIGLFVIPEVFFAIWGAFN